MRHQLEQLIEYALNKKASDLHFYKNDEHLQIQLRTAKGMCSLHQDLWDPKLFSYLKFIAGLDLTNPKLPQSGSFSIEIQGKKIDARFSILHNQHLETGVLRLFAMKSDLKIEELTRDQEAIDFMKQLTHFRQGLFLACGPTNSGKTTTIHAILHEIALSKRYKIVSLEDPVEIQDPLFVQLQVNEEEGFTYEKGIEQLMRHDPDIIYIGEIRSAYCAKKMVNCALSGHLVVSTIHAGNAKEALFRLLDFGIEAYDLIGLVSGVFAQRLYQTPSSRKECIYEIVDRKEAETILLAKEYSTNHVRLEQRIQRALESNRIKDEQAKFDIQALQA